MQKLKDYWQNLSDNSKKMLMAIAGGTAAIAIIAVLVLKLGTNTDYSTLFTGLNQEEAQEVVALLQDEGIDYRFNDKEGAIRVPAAGADQTRAELLAKGYPKSGFTYDMYRNNAGLMTTESDKKQYTLYDLQDRLGAQIRLFEGVQDAKVTIAEAAEQKYALQDNTNMDASASVVVTMAGGQSLSESKASAIKNLIARSVRGLNFTNVAVFDADTMMEVGGTSSGEDAFGSAKDLTALTGLIENNISVNVRRVLEKLYGQGNVAVSVKGTVNMERLIQENTRYSTPEKIDEQDKTGLLNREDTLNENTAAADQGAGGVAGADANADTPRYTNQANNQAIADSYSNSSATREWLYDSVKEQRQVDPGVLENATVGIVINTDDTTTVTNNQLLNLVADSAGIPRDQASQCITIVRAPSQEVVPVIVPPDQPGTEDKGLPLPIIIAMAAGGVLILLLLVLLLMERRRRRKKADEYVDSPGMYAVEEEAREAETEVPVNVLNTEAGMQMQAENAEMERNEEILNLRMQHSLKLKQNIGDFVDQNPQIAAKLVQSWLRGEVEDLAGNRRRKER